MNSFTEIVKKRLKNPPTAVRILNEKIALAFKSKSVTILDINLKVQSDISFESKLSSLEANDEIYVGLENGKICKLNGIKDSKTYSKIQDKFITTLCFIDDLLYVGSKSRKIRVFNSKLECTETLYGPTSTVLSLDSFENDLLCVSENDSKIRIFKINEKNHSIYNLKNGLLPTGGVFLTEYLFVIGTSKGKIELFNTNKRSSQDSVDIQDEISCMTRIKRGLVAVGTITGSLILFKLIEKKLVEIYKISLEGIINCMYFKDNLLAVGCSREPKFGRWKVEGKNLLVLYKIEEEK